MINIHTDFKGYLSTYPLNAYTKELLNHNRKNWSLQQNLKKFSQLLR